MYLAAYHFTGDPVALLKAPDRVMETYDGESLDLHVCVPQVDGVLVLDACPTRADFEQFSRSQEFRAALSAVGLPEPRIEGVGEVHTIQGSALTGVTS